MAGSLGKLAIGLMLCLTGVGIPLGLALIADGVKDFATGKPVSWGSMVSGIKEALGNISDEWNKFKRRLRTASLFNSLPSKEQCFGMVGQRKGLSGLIRRKTVSLLKLA